MEKQYLTIKETANILGVTPLTLRNWDKKGKLVAHRHPLNNYRVYKTEDLLNLLESIEISKTLVREKKEEIKRLSVRHLEEENSGERLS